MRKVLYVIIVFEYVRESERVVISGKAKVITLVLVLIVRNTIAYPVPAHSLLLLDFSRKWQDPHSVVVERVRLHEIDYIEAYLLTLGSISYSKEVPLRVTVRIYVIL